MIPGEGNGYPLQYSGLENFMDRGAWQAKVHGVSKSWTQVSDFHKIYYSVSFLLQECPNHVLFSEMYPAFLWSMYLGYHPTYNLCDVSTVFEISFHARLYVLSAFCSLKLVQNTYYVLFYLILTAALWGGSHYFLFIFPHYFQFTAEETEVERRLVQG